jgi:hypothetical protein
MEKLVTETNLDKPDVGPSPTKARSVSLALGEILSARKGPSKPKPLVGRTVGGTVDRDDVICTNSTPIGQRRGAGRSGYVHPFRQEVLVGSDAIFDGGLFRFAQRDFLKQPEQMLLSLQQ